MAQKSGPWDLKNQTFRTPAELLVSPRLSQAGLQGFLLGMKDPATRFTMEGAEDRVACAALDTLALSHQPAEPVGHSLSVMSATVGKGRSALVRHGGMTARVVMGERRRGFGSSWPTIDRQSLAELTPPASQESDTARVNSEEKVGMSNCKMLVSLEAGRRALETLAGACVTADDAIFFCSGTSHWSIFPLPHLETTEASGEAST
ncbi:hypothetical protein BDK51DRAFT_52925 [Blyttiomyces helicus]|uniref:Uncharacterized protein n=1 Tax=Blyttiomyces helicus TaxID=388810 RepID=A0A4P9W854_9FUNG|nr:hypothetical protein BDK51DRAFT_52925 [Blyttiomyces helicus]|eukprot:RKO86970.1 hypothetical protein BDK51DRAFT_52925 [Blyttiomyces helicus]